MGRSLYLYQLLRVDDEWGKTGHSSGEGVRGGTVRCRVGAWGGVV